MRSLGGIDYLYFVDDLVTRARQGTALAVRARRCRGGHGICVSKHANGEGVVEKRNHPFLNFHKRIR